jgi:hypothetical protein
VSSEFGELRRYTLPRQQKSGLDRLQTAARLELPLNLSLYRASTTH